MNPSALIKYVGRVLMALAATSGLFLTVSCGSSSRSGPPPNKGGFSDSNLNGTYVISISGTDVNAGAFSFFAIVGTITADGKGNITGGTVDINDANLGGTGVFVGQTLSASTYGVSQDGRGTGRLVTPVGTFGLDFVLTSNSHGLITRFDTAGSGSGTLDLQGSASQSSLTSLAFFLSGADARGNSLGSVGAFALDSSGTINSGTEDFNDNGSSAISGSAGLPLTGSVVLASSTSGTAKLSSSAFSTPLAFDVWVIDSTHLKLIETDTFSGAPALSGDAFTQETSFTAGQLVYTLSGLDPSGNPFAAGGFATTDSHGNITNAIEDFNDAGSTNTSSAVTGTCTTFVAGRCQLALTGFSNGTSNNFTFAAYPSSGGVLLLEDDSLGLVAGAAYTQTATAFSAPAGYGLTLSGANFDPSFNSWFEVDDIAQFNATSTTIDGILDENDLSLALVPRAALSGTYTPDSPATGRGSIIATATGTFIGGLTLEYYVVDSSTVLFIEGDSQQVALGMFELQSSSMGLAAHEAATAPRVMFMVHPLGRSHAVKRSR